MSNPIVSVIVPVHNAEKYLEQCFESILGQTLGDIEVICVNNRPTDGSAVILDGFAEKDPRLSVLQSPGLGAGGARNIGLRAAKGKYLSFLDADDFFEPDMLEATVEQAEREITATSWSTEAGSTTRSSSQTVRQSGDCRWIGFRRNVHSSHQISRTVCSTSLATMHGISCSAHRPSGRTTFSSRRLAEPTTSSSPARP